MSYLKNKEEEKNPAVIDSQKNIDPNQKDTSGIKGIDAETDNRLNSTFNQSEESKKADIKRNDALGYYEGIVNQENIIDPSVMNTINKSFEMPAEITQADTYLATQLKKIQSGKTSYSDDLKDMMDKIMGREKFSYDVDTDPLFQQALASAMNSGKQAMQDTIGQASALTGGYGSTYATSAGNQAYNSFIEDAYDNLPQYYQMALEAYQMEGDEMYRQFDMISGMDDKEYNRTLSAYDATFNYRNQMYNEAYGQHRDEKSDAFGMANLQLNEYGQRSSNAYNYYTASANEADTMYQREYGQWQDDVNLAYQYAQLMNSDYWNQSNQDFQATENRLNREHTSAENQLNRDFQASEAEKDRAFTASENAKSRAASRSGSPVEPTLVNPKYGDSVAVKTFNANIMTPDEFSRRGETVTVYDSNGQSHTKTFGSYNEYVDYKIDGAHRDGKINDDEAVYLAWYHLG